MAMKHEFAMYVAHLSSYLSPKRDYIELQDPDAVHRIRSVLRLAQDDELILFDGVQQVVCTITDMNKKTVLVRILSNNRTVSLDPSVTFLLPLLKKEALERMIYACVELGANTIQLVITEKSQRSWRSEKELQRMQAIMVAAAEQSKQFAIPEMYPPCSLPEALQHHTKHDIKLVADPAGTPLYQVLTQVVQNMHAHKKSSLVITMGPEGDFTETERELLRTASYQAVRLTPTVLRSQQAGALLLGTLRSIISE